MTEKLFVVQGAPGSGKTTLAIELARSLNIPLVSKDSIKEALYDTAPVDSVEGSVLLGKASIAAMYAAAGSIISNGKSCIIESAFNVEFANADIADITQDLDTEIVQLYCELDEDERVRRFKQRQDAGRRHTVHFDDIRSDIERGGARQVYAPLNIAKTINVDTANPVDVERLLVAISEI